MGPLAAAFEASLVCNHSKVTGFYTRQSYCRHWVKEFCAGLTSVASSCVKCLSGLMFSPGFDFERISSIANNVRLQEHRAEDSRL